MVIPTSAQKNSLPPGPYMLWVCLLTNPATGGPPPVGARAVPCARAYKVLVKDP